MIKIFIKFSLAAFFLLLVLILFSTVETKYQCIGKMKQGDSIIESRLYLKLTENRWWVRLLGGTTDGEMDLEVPGKNYALYHYVDKVGDQVQFWRERGSLVGGIYSTLSGYVALNDSFGFFEGECKRLQ